ncbi:unnamed protein product, partial [Polarella glacialis]
MAAAPGWTPRPPAGCRTGLKIPRRAHADGFRPCALSSAAQFHQVVGETDCAEQSSTPGHEYFVDLEAGELVDATLASAGDRFMGARLMPGGGIRLIFTSPEGSSEDVQKAARVASSEDHTIFSEATLGLRHAANGGIDQTNDYPEDALEHGLIAERQTAPVQKEAFVESETELQWLHASSGLSWRWRDHYGVTSSLADGFSPSQSRSLAGPWRSRPHAIPQAHGLMPKGTPQTMMVDSDAARGPPLATTGGRKGRRPASAGTFRENGLQTLAGPRLARPASAAGARYTAAASPVPINNSNHNHNNNNNNNSNHNHNNHNNHNNNNNANSSEAVRPARPPSSRPCSARSVSTGISEQQRPASAGTHRERNASDPREGIAAKQPSRPSSAGASGRKSPSLLLLRQQQLLEQASCTAPGPSFSFVMQNWLSSAKNCRARASMACRPIWGDKQQQQRPPGAEQKLEQKQRLPEPVEQHIQEPILLHEQILKQPLDIVNAISNSDQLANHESGKQLQNGPWRSPLTADSSSSGVKKMKPAIEQTPSSCRPDGTAPEFGMRLDRAAPTSNPRGIPSIKPGKLGAKPHKAHDEPAVESKCDAILEADEHAMDQKLLAIFARVADDGEVHKDILIQALELSGARSPIKEWVDEIVNEMTRYTTLDQDEFLTFVRRYTKVQDEGYRNAFQHYDADRSGTIEGQELAELLASLGITPMEQVIQEIIDEVDADGTGDLTLTEFSHVLRLLGERDGFGKDEYNRLMATFKLYDLDATGQLETTELAAVLGYLAYSPSTEEVDTLVSEVDIDGSGSFNVFEFIFFMRKVRESEITHIKAELKHLEHCCVSSKEELLHKLLRSLGYFPDRQAVVDAAADSNLSMNSSTAARFDWKTKSNSCQGEDPLFNTPTLRPRQEAGHSLTLAEAYRFLEVYRGREGFTRSESDELAVTFNKFAGVTLGSLPSGTDLSTVGLISNFDCGRAIQWLGYQSPYEVQELLFTEVNLNCSGFISFKEFLKLVRRYRIREIEEIRTSILIVGMHNMGSDMVGKVQLAKALAYLGCEDEEAASLDRNVLEQMQNGSQDAEGADFGPIRAALQKRTRIRARARRTAAFTPSEVRELRKKFDSYDRDGGGDVDSSELRHLCQDLLPEMASDSTHRPELVRLLREVDTSGDGSLDFDEFLQLVRNLHDGRKKQKMVKERKIVEALGFTKSQIREFREVFVCRDLAGKDSLVFEVVKELLHAVVPLGDRLVRLLAPDSITLLKT